MTTPEAEGPQPLSADELKFWRENSHGQSQQLRRRLIATIDASEAARRRYEEALRRITDIGVGNQASVRIARAALSDDPEQLKKDSSTL